MGVARHVQVMMRLREARHRCAYEHDNHGQSRDMSVRADTEWMKNEYDEANNRMRKILVHEILDDTQNKPMN